MLGGNACMYVCTQACTHETVHEASATLRTDLKLNSVLNCCSLSWPAGFTMGQPNLAPAKTNRPD